MDFVDVVTSRKSVRDYPDKAVEEEKLEKILKMQDWRLPGQINNALYTSLLKRKQSKNLFIRKKW